MPYHICLSEWIHIYYDHIHTQTLWRNITKHFSLSCFTTFPTTFYGIISISFRALQERNNFVCSVSLPSHTVCVEYTQVVFICDTNDPLRINNCMPLLPLFPFLSGELTWEKKGKGREKVVSDLTFDTIIIIIYHIFHFLISPLLFTLNKFLIVLISRPHYYLMRGTISVCINKCWCAPHGAW